MNMIPNDELKRALDSNALHAVSVGKALEEARIAMKPLQLNNIAIAKAMEDARVTKMEFDRMKPLRLDSMAKAMEEARGAKIDFDRIKMLGEATNSQKINDFLAANTEAMRTQSLKNQALVTDALRVLSIPSPDFTRISQINANIQGIVDRIASEQKRFQDMADRLAIPGRTANELFEKMRQKEEQMHELTRHFEVDDRFSQSSMNQPVVQDLPEADKATFFL